MQNEYYVLNHGRAISGEKVYNYDVSNCNKKRADRKLKLCRCNNNNNNMDL